MDCGAYETCKFVQHCESGLMAGEKESEDWFAFLATRALTIAVQECHSETDSMHGSEMLFSKIGLSCIHELC